MNIILGSQSPRRRELLTRMGLRFSVLTAEIDETKYETHDPVESVRRICAAKAAAVAARLTAPEAGSLPPTLVLTADTIVVLDGRIMGKPRDEAEARTMLAALSGREHRVCTAFCLLPLGLDGREPYTHVEQTRVKFRDLTPAEIAAYVTTGEPMDKAGAYGIQDLGAMLVESIHGDYFTVMGLPVCKLSLALKQFGVDPFRGANQPL